ncbi:MAG: hypothetical protein HND51_12650 [Chloroflexi bacterium]|nr:hypothetical protein [Chloroflexota bacterium]
MQNQEKPQLPHKEEMRLKVTVRFAGLLLLISLLITPVFFVIDRFPSKGMLVPLVITSAVLVIGSVATFLVFPAWYRYRHLRNAEEDQNTDLFP